MLVKRVTDGVEFLDRFCAGGEPASVREQLRVSAANKVAPPNSLAGNASAIGGLGGGNIRTALVEQGAGFAIQDLENQRRELASLSGGGLAAGTLIR